MGARTATFISRSPVVIKPDDSDLLLGEARDEGTNRQSLKGGGVNF